MGRPKALLAISGETFVSRLLRVFRAAGAHVIVVTGAHDREIRAALDGAGAEIVTNPDPARGMLSSLQEGLRRVPAHCEIAGFHSVDTPLVSESTVASLRAELEQAQPDRLMAVPRHGGRRGHPVLFRASLADEFLALASDATARDVIHAHRGDTVYIDVEDPGILIDIDTPDDYKRLVSGAAQ